MGLAIQGQYQMTLCFLEILSFSDQMPVFPLKLFLSLFRFQSNTEWLIPEHLQNLFYLRKFHIIYCSPNFRKLMSSSKHSVGESVYLPFPDLYCRGVNKESNSFFFKPSKPAGDGMKWILRQIAKTIGRSLIVGDLDPSASQVVMYNSSLHIHEMHVRMFVSGALAGI